jgi:N-methylhydantoinase A/oxoprolinase/acetone carboxylase beta subunit
MPIIVLNIRVALAGPVEKPKLPKLRSGNGKADASALLYKRPVHWAGDGDQAVHVPFYDRSLLLAGDTIEGPAAVVEKTTTTLLHAGDVCKTDEHANLRIAKESINGKR